MEYQKTAETTGYLIANKIAKVSRSSSQNNSETITNEHDKEISEKRYIIQKKDRKLLII